jgi:penicillin-insensitive murein endopeptidase
MGGSIGTTSHGVLIGGAQLGTRPSLKWLRQNDRHFGVPRFVRAIEHAADEVARARAGSVLVVGDISSQGGGPISGHASHRSGRDADLLLYMTTIDGAPIENAHPGFASVDADGLAFDPHHGRYVRLDVEREWLLVRALITDPEARVQWIFVSEVIEALLVEWARARGDDPEIIARAQEVMLQPRRPSLPHDDHIHVRTECTDEEVVRGCMRVMPMRAWLREEAPAAPADDDVDLVLAIVGPMGGGTTDGKSSSR